jgi:hypothetical protein
MEVRFDGTGKGRPSSSLSLFVTGFAFEHIAAVSLPRGIPDTDRDKQWRDWVETTKPDTSAYIGIGGLTRFQAFAKTLRADYAELDNHSGGIKGIRGSVLEGFDSPDTNAFELPDVVVQEVTMLRSVFRTNKGYMGITAGTAQPGDVICLVCGSSMPLVLREDGMKWLFVGQAYVHGIMDGEALHPGDLAKVKRTFEIG